MSSQSILHSCEEFSSKKTWLSSKRGQGNWEKCQRQKPAVTRQLTFNATIAMKMEPDVHGASFAPIVLFRLPDKPNAATKNSMSRKPHIDTSSWFWYCVDYCISLNTNTVLPKETLETELEASLACWHARGNTHRIPHTFP